MLAILLGILKVIGITLLIFLGLVLLIVALVLWVPIRYKGDGRINEQVKEAGLKVTWLLHAVHIQINYSYPGKPETVIRVFGINIEKFKKKKEKSSKVKAPKPKKPKKEGTKKEKRKENKPRYDINMALLSDYEAENKEASATASEKNGAFEEMNTPEDATVSENIRRMVDQAQALQKETWRDKLKGIVNKITSVYNKIRNVIWNIRYYLDILQQEDTQAVIKVSLDALLDILKKLRPRKLTANAQIGFETPDTTGKIYGLYWIWKPALGEHVEITPDFEKKIIKGDVFFKGSITVYVLLVNALKIVLDKRFKPFINKFKNGGLQNG